VGIHVFLTGLSDEDVDPRVKPAGGNWGAIDPFVPAPIHPQPTLSRGQGVGEGGRHRCLRFDLIGFRAIRRCMCKAQ
jgi:hypothetical protein